MTNTEIERKFLVTGDGYKKEAVRALRMTQGYICREKGRTVRVRIALDETPEAGAAEALASETGASGAGAAEAGAAEAGAAEAAGRSGGAWLTIKGGSSDNGLSRMEWEMAIPVEDARTLMGLCGQDGTGIIDKTRYFVPFEGHTFEVDEFHGLNEGLTIAEVELKSETEPVGKPNWLGKEVTGDRRYYNSMLTVLPYSQWAEKDRPASRPE